MGAVAIRTSGTKSFAQFPQWNSTPWNSARWVPITQVISHWQAAPGIGIAAAARMMVNVKGSPLAFEALTYAFEVGGLF